MLPKILRRKEVEKWAGVGRSTLYSWVKEGHFPKPIKLNLKEGKRISNNWMRDAKLCGANIFGRRRY